MPETKRITEKLLEVSGRKFKIKKLDARMASYLAFQIASFIPMGSGAEGVMNGASKGMTRKDFYSLQNDCLSACYHVEKAGEIPVLDDNSNIQDPQLSTDAKAVILLTINSLAFNVTDFFDADFLKELDANMKSILPSGVKMQASS